VTSILPVLALHARPDFESGWTKWTWLSRRRIAALAGVNKDTVGTGFSKLVAQGLAEMERKPRTRHQPGFTTWYRLVNTLYPRGDERWAKLAGNLFYGGAWSILPYLAARHLYVVVASLDPIGDEDAYLVKASGILDRDPDCPYSAEYFLDMVRDCNRAEVLGRDEEELEQMLALRRSGSTVSIADLEKASGLSRNTTIKALRVLNTPMLGESGKARRDVHSAIALLERGRGREGDPAPWWYCPDRRSERKHLDVEILNDPTRVNQTRKAIWKL
jgi:hypothetical protein